jgi:UDP-galactopyranose mutase
LNTHILIVGAGLSGATVARELADAGHDVTVIDRRGHIAGNAFDETNELGIRVHRYGPHYFHTSNMTVVQWLSRFTEWVPYRHRGKAMLADGRFVTFPVNRETAAIVGRDNVLDIFYRPYTLKMWGHRLEDMHPSLIARVPIREDDNEDYFPNDTFQALPADGYTAMVKNILDHPRIRVRLGEALQRRHGWPLRPCLQLHGHR